MIPNSEWKVEMDKPNCEDLVAAVAKFSEWVTLQGQDLKVELMCEVKPATSWSDEYLIDASLPGVYAFENFDGEIFYVGSVTANTGIGRRFSSDYVSKGTGSDSVVRKGNALDAVKFHAVTLSQEFAFMAPALEQFLVSYLQPAENKLGCIDALRRQMEDRGLDIRSGIE